MRDRSDKLAWALRQVLLKEASPLKEPAWHPTLAELEAYCKGEIPSKLRDELRDHLVDCSGCSDLLLVCRDSPDLQAELERFLNPDLAENAESEKEIAESWRELNEADLLQKIQGRLSQDLDKRYTFLVMKREDESLTPFEYRELLDLSDQIEKLEVQRLEALIRLARLRDVPFDRLVKELGLQPDSNG